MALSIGNPVELTSLLKGGYQYFEEPIFRNIQACGDLFEVVRTAFGPYGLNKLIQNKLGKLFVTSDAATIVNELEVIHPAARLLSLASSQQDSEYGDGTNFVMMFSGELLNRAEELLRMGIHRNQIIEGYQDALRNVNRTIESIVVKTIESFDKSELVDIVRSCIGTKQYGQREFLTNLVLEAVSHVMPKVPREFSVDAIRTIKILGSGLSNSRVIPGMVFGRQPETRVKSVVGARICIFGCPLDVGRTETKGTVLLKNSGQLLNFSRDEETMLENQFKAIAGCGANVLVTGGGVGELALHYIDKMGLMAIKVPSKFDLERLCRAVGATALARLGTPTAEDMGFCDVVETVEIGSDRCTVFRQETQTTKTVTVLLRGSTMNYLDDIERSIDDGIGVIKSLTQDGRLLAGAGSTEIKLASMLEEMAATMSELKHYGMRKYGEALEIVPKCLCENAGLNSEIVLGKLNVRHKIEKEKHFGVDIDNDQSEILDPIRHGILDSFAVKKHGIYLATEAVISILRVDSIVMSKSEGLKSPKQGSIDED